MVVTSRVESRKGKEWRERMERFAASGQQAKVFCQAEGVSETVFYRWRQRLQDVAQSAPGFIAVRPAPSDGAMASKAAPWELRLDLGDGLVLHLARH
jgi:putative transposase